MHYSVARAQALARGSHGKALPGGPAVGKGLRSGSPGAFGGGPGYYKSGAQEM